ncbi:MAG: FAD-binding oxidoreductase [Hyphomicrobiales bacterium]|nr:FAD-binding oxidoreductase [Hyphomicrobiales bacterium]MCY4038550.1 FAD-binding oxidoreductase [Hyphomicrobiales bacterium]
MSEKIVVAGAGIVGVSTAIWLQRAGYEVMLVDKEGPAAGTSHGNAGVLAAASITPVTMPGLIGKAPLMLLDRNSPLFLRLGYLPRLIPFLGPYLSHCNERDVRRYADGMTPLIYDTVAQHRALAAGTGAESFIEDGDYCFGYASRAEFKADEFAWKLRNERGIAYEICSGEEYAETDPFYAGNFDTVVRCANHGRISDPGAYVKALVEHFVSEGGGFIRAAVSDIEINESGRAGLVTDEGPIGGDKIALTTGVWSKPLLTKFGLSIPLETERGYHIELVAPDSYPKNSMMVVSGKFVVTPMRGRIRCAGIVEFAGLKTASRQQPLDMLKRRIKQLFPNLKYREQSEWLGHRPALTDSLPMIGRVTDEAELFTAFGHQHLGLTGGAKTGRIMADLMSGAQMTVNVIPYRTDRF